MQNDKTDIDSYERDIASDEFKKSEYNNLQNIKLEIFLKIHVK
jgi:hypothetical protein